MSLFYDFLLTLKQYITGQGSVEFKTSECSQNQTFFEFELIIQVFIIYHTRLVETVAKYF